MRELALKLGIICGALMALALFMSISSIVQKKPVNLSLEIAPNSSIHLPASKALSGIQLASADPEITGSIVQNDEGYEPRALVKYSSGWSVNRANKGALAR